MVEEKALVVGHFSIKDPEKFNRAVMLLKESLIEETAASFFCSDNWVTWNRSLHFY